ncbi:MAG: Fe-S cluster assembly protein SufD [Azospirillaceae bacterium]|nr:Fe-S cluster assembly protein SufD [Azospirillaceae bacterium]
MTSAIQPYLDSFHDLIPGLPGAGLGWLDRLRHDGLARFAATGFPSQRVEAWKYTSLRALERSVFAPAGHATPPAIDRLPTVAPDPRTAHRLVLVDGRFRPDLSSVPASVAGIASAGLADLLAGSPGDVPTTLAERHLGSVATLETGLTAVNTAFVSDGLVIHVAAGVAVAQPIEVVFIATGGAAASPTLHHPRLLLVAEPDSQVTLVEHHVGLGDGPYATNTVVEIVVGDRAVVNHTKIQREGQGAIHIATTAARIGSEGRYDHFGLTLGAALSRNDIVPILGAGASCRLAGAYLLRGRQHADTTTAIEHSAPRATSRQVYKGVIDDTAHGVFQGRILVRPGAQKTDAYQINRALLLSAGAEIDSKPELEIHADDVKCSHGATAGELDDDQLFYLRARGIDRDDARRLLIGAFVGEAIDEISDATVAAAVRALADAWLTTPAAGSQKGMGS